MAGGVAADPRKWSNIIFGALFALSLLLFARIIWPFALPVLLGAFIAVLFMPVQDWLCARMKTKSNTLCAALSTFAVFVLILVPLGTLAYFLGRELIIAIELVKELLDKTDIRAELLDKLPYGLRRYVPAKQMDEGTGTAVAGALAGGAAMVTDLLSKTTELAIDLFLMVVAIYYFFLDGKRLVSEIIKLIPMDVRYSEAFVKEFKDVTYAIMWGNTLTALIQGAIGTVGLMLAGVPSPLLWGAAMAVFAMVPIGGTAIIWVPLSIALILTRHVNEGLFLLGWGAFLVSTVDNVIRPRLAGSRMHMHPLLVFLSMFGGIAVVGVLGIVVGPLVAAICMAMIRIYKRDFLHSALPHLALGNQLQKA